MFDEERRRFFKEAQETAPLTKNSTAYRSFQLQPALERPKNLNRAQAPAPAHKSTLEELSKSKRSLPNRKAAQSPFTVHSKALRLGQPVYTEKNAFRELRKVAMRQVGDLLKDFYEDKVNNLQGGKFNRWKSKPVTKEEDTLPMDGRDAEILDKIQREQAEKKRRERALVVWGGPPLAELVGHHHSQAALNPSDPNSKSPRR